MDFGRSQCRFLVLVAGALLCTSTEGGRAAEPPATLVLERTIALKDVHGRIDHMAIDVGRKRLFVAELGNGTLDAIDIATGQVIKRIPGLKEPQGVGYVARADVVAIASAGDGSVRLFSGEELSPSGIVRLGDDADNIRVDTRTGSLVVGYGSGGLAVIDPATATVTRRIALPAHPEGFRLDPDKARAYVNLPDARQIAVVNMDSGRQAGELTMPNLRDNFPMALDDTRTTVIVAFRNPPTLVTLDVGNGKPTNTLPTCRDADDVAYDSRRRRLYVSCGEGRLDIWQRDEPAYRHLGFVETAPGARTSLFVPELDRLFVAARSGLFWLGNDAAILVMRPNG
jgi:hypothetical protein